ncbi:MAG TPA: transcription elongation factor GreB [Pseudobdellovibrionaceae bacterium]|nr:transcription elongation factor GreB [Pseudobdellovibrionaceae bacterium]
MSKAFVREDDDNNAGDVEGLDAADMGGDEADDVAAKAIAQAGGKNYITLKGLEKLKAELHELLHVERPKVVDVVAWAASNGDRSENADYTYGKKRLREIDRRVRFLQKRIDMAVPVDPATQRGQKVLFGASVTVVDESGREREYAIVGVDETNAERGRVSWISPIGRALLQAQVGDVVVLRSPKGDEDLEIVKLEYKALD